MQDILKADASHVIPDKLPCGSMKDILNADASHAGMPLGSTPRPENVQLDTGATWATLGCEPHRFVSLRDGLEKALASFHGVFTK